MMSLEHESLDLVAERLAVIAVEAGRLLRKFENAIAEHRVKADGSPATVADLAAEQLIIDRLAAIWPDVPVVAEETANAAEAAERFFLVDPLDGTRDFLHGTGEYSVNIALVENGRPAAAVVAAPSVGRIWIAGERARTAEIPAEAGAEIAWAEAAVRSPGDRELVALVSRRHGDDATEACLSTLSIGTRRTASSALKFCLIASGEADVYVRCGPTMEWDTAAGDHILTRAGGCVVGPGGGPLTYGNEARGYRNGPFAALGDASIASRLSLPVAAA